MGVVTNLRLKTWSKKRRHLVMVLLEYAVESMSAI